MIFLDTSAIYAWSDSADPNHKTAVARLGRLVERQERLLTHNYVLVESLALVQARLGIAAALKLAADTRMFAVEWVDDALHLAAVDALAKSAKRQLSLVDHVSFLVMRQRGVTTAFAFDPDFRTAGFALFEA